MKTNTNKKDNRQLQARVQKITEKLCFVFLFATIGISLFVPETYRYYDILFFGVSGAFLFFGIMGIMLEPNTDSYCCKVCGHTQIPEGNTSLRSKMRLECPVCKQCTVHKFVLPEKYEKEVG